MDVFVVIDTSGCGRIVGVFDSEAKAQDVAAVDPGYYKLHRVRMNELNLAVRAWATNPEQKKRLDQLIGE